MAERAHRARERESETDMMSNLSVGPKGLRHPPGPQFKRKPICSPVCGPGARERFMGHERRIRFQASRAIDKADPAMTETSFRPMVPRGSGRIVLLRMFSILLESMVRRRSCQGLPWGLPAGFID